MRGDESGRASGEWLHRGGGYPSFATVATPLSEIPRGRLARIIVALRTHASRAVLSRDWAKAEQCYLDAVVMERRYLTLANEDQRGWWGCRARLWHAEVMAVEMGERARGLPLTPTRPIPWMTRWRQAGALKGPRRDAMALARLAVATTEAPLPLPLQPLPSGAA